MKNEWLKPVVWIIAGCLLGGGSSGWAATPDRYNVVWDSPSATSDGTMPLGNGEIALNAWVEPSGELRFFIARTDAWDDYGRLLKVGGVRFNLEPNPFAAGTKFRQELDLKSGSILIQADQAGQKTELRLWVDANRPVICLEATTAQPTVATLRPELWRTNQFALEKIECSDVLNGSKEKAIIEPDTVLTGLKDRIGWYHRNIKSVGPELCGKIQGVAEFKRPDPLLHRTFGALVATDRAERVDDRTLRSTSGTTHLFEIAVHTRIPVTADQWLAETQEILQKARALPLAQRRSAHEQWWGEFWNRSWINITQNSQPVQRAETAAFPPVNKLPVSIGLNSGGGSRFNGSFGRVGIYETALKDAEIAALAATEPQAKAVGTATPLYSDVPQSPKALPELADHTFAGGITIEAWIKSEALKGDMRIVDKIKPGGTDGFLLDVCPENSLRLIVGHSSASQKGVLKPGVWQHVAATVTPTGNLKLFLDGKPFGSTGATATAAVADGDDAFVVGRGYTLQRFINACAGRGHYPIKYNGSIVTVPAEGRHSYADYRAWGPGYWWQNTRLPYFSMPASGDFELMEPLFQMYARDLMPFFKYRTQRYVNHEGAYIPECIYFWGDMFSETYGWQPFEERTDKLQASRWHKWEWVSGLELVSLLLDRYEYSGDEKFLRDTVLPAAHELLTFFDQQYTLSPEGKLVMHPGQACETWWDCVNPMPELAGLHAATERLLALPESLVDAKERVFWTQLRAKLPPLPTTPSPDGRPMLAPAQEFKMKHNCECPELYAVFPFRQIAVGRPNLDWGIEALKHRRDRGPFGWRQEDSFMAYLGLTDQARDYVVQRARHKHAASRFPAFWGPNYDWVPDQCHGGNLMKATQALLLQTDGRKIYLLPAWPKDWDCEFKLHAPYQTVLEGKVVDGKITDLKVTPEERRKDLVIMDGSGGR